MSCQPHLPNTAGAYLCMSWWSTSNGPIPTRTRVRPALRRRDPFARNYPAFPSPTVTLPHHTTSNISRIRPLIPHPLLSSLSPRFMRGAAAIPSHTHFPPPLAKIPVTLPFPSFPPLPTPAQAIPFNFPRSSPLPSRVRGLYSPPWIVGCDYSGPGEGSPRGAPCAVRWRLVALMVSFPILVPIFPFYLPMDSRVSGVVCNLGANFADVHFIIMQKNINAKLCMLHLALIPYCTRHSLSV